MSKSRTVSPIMKQYQRIKNEHKEAILFFRLGDFYEMFYEDAIIASEVLEIVLTKKTFGLNEDKAPLAGIPVKTADAYIAKLVKAGYKIAICEQVSNAPTAKGLVDRKVVRIVSPGTATDDTILDSNENNFLLSIGILDDKTAIAYIDVSTGESEVLQIKNDYNYEKLLSNIIKVNPVEIVLLVLNTPEKLLKKIKTLQKEISQTDDDKIFEENFEIDKYAEVEILALNILFTYAERMCPDLIYYAKKPRVFKNENIMNLDGNTIRNLELLETLFEKNRKNSLIGVLDKTKTSAGTRLLSSWIKNPLVKKNEILNRQNITEYFFNEDIKRNNIREYLKSVYDLERIIGKLISKNASAKDMLSLLSTFSILPEIKNELTAEEISKNFGELHQFPELVALLESAIKEEPPPTIKEGGIIKEGYSKELDDFKTSIKDANDYLVNLEFNEKQRTGIKNLKVRFNKIFGYFIEIPNGSIKNLPDEYIRKQTLVNAERFITPKLKEVENKILSANIEINDLEYKIFCNIRDKIAKEVIKIQELSRTLSKIDVLISFAEVAVQNDYIKPAFKNTAKHEIISGRHPIVENLVEGNFVKNDTYFDSDNNFLLITGPNMGGKSTYMKQTALISIMAQIGSFIPCESANLEILDGIYTRIGAFDNIERGESTFFVEMKELSYILKNATKNSLVLLDEVGRGTSTYDGLSIAYAASKYLIFKTKTMFATHYHELSDMLNEKGVAKLYTEISKENRKITLLHKIAKGDSKKSYGIDVARLAGISEEVLRLAEEELKNLEKNKAESSMNTSERAKKKKSEEEQLSFFKYINEPVLAKIKALNLEETTPLDAIKFLEEIKKYI